MTKHRTVATKVAFLGPLYTNGHSATAAASPILFPQYTHILCPTNSDIVRAVVEDRANYGILPVANSQADIVIPSFDAIHLARSSGFTLYIYGEVHLPVRHYLFAPPQSHLADIKTVISHPHALNQCNGFVSRHRVTTKESTSTAAAACEVATSKDLTLAAICSKMAGSAYGLVPLTDHSIEDDCNNRTLFVILSQTNGHAPTGQDMTWVAFKCANEPGALWSTITPLKEGGINMTTFHSRTVGLSVCRFYAALEGHQDDPTLARALAAMRDVTEELHILGSYPKNLIPLE